MKRAIAKKRTDAWLKEIFPGLSNRHIDEALAEKLILSTDGKPLKKGEKISALPDTSKLLEHLEKLRKGSPIEGIRVVFEGSDFVIIDKPAGIPSHPLSLFDEITVTAWAFHHYSKLEEEFPGTIQPTLCPHRLDTGTSGLLIVCLTQASYKRWREKFSKKKVTKTYLAWCWGRPKETSWTDKRPIAHHPKDTKRMVVLRSKETKYRAPAMPAETDFEVLKQMKDRFLVKAVMKSGVTHQVRVHLASQGFPLLGDTLYDSESNRPETPKTHLLRAVKIETNEITIEAESKTFESLYLRVL